MRKSRPCRPRRSFGGASLTGEQGRTVLSGDVLLLSRNARSEVWSARPVSGRWRLHANEPEAAEIRDLLRIRGKFDAVAAIEAGLAAPRKRRS
jgi:hypothetical protein